MSELYCDNGGFSPLPLPSCGESLQIGRQYVLTPQARRSLKDTYGYVNVPSLVECTSAKRPATRIRSYHENLETGAGFWRVTDFPGTESSFRTYVGNGKYLKFDLPLEKLKELEPYYDTSHLFKEGGEKRVKQGKSFKEPKSPKKPVLDPAWFDVPS